MTEAEAQQILQSAQTGMRNPLLPQFFRWKYHDEPVLARGDQVYPVAAFPAPATQQNDLESVLMTPLAQAIPTEAQIGDDGFRQLTVASGRPAHDLPTYTMRKMIADGARLQLRCAMGSYFRMLDTCDALEWEALRQAETLTDTSEVAFAQFDRQLRLRKALHEHVALPVRDGAHRSVALAVSLLIAYQHEGSLHLLLHRRSANVATNPGLLHIIPSFMFQPATTHVAQEFSLRHNIEREYLEELFSLPESADGETDWRYFYDDSRLQFLRALLEQGQAELSLTGVSVSLLNLRPDICALLLIRSEEWYRRHIGDPPTPHDALRLNPEYAADDTGISAPISALAFDAAETDTALIRRGGITAAQMVPAGAGAFWLGVDVLRRRVAGAGG